MASATKLSRERRNERIFLYTLVARRKDKEVGENDRRRCRRRCRGCEKSREKRKRGGRQKARERERAKVYRELLAEEEEGTTGDSRYHLSSACLPAKQPANAIQFA